MKLSQKALQKLDRAKRFQVALALGFSEQWINKLFDTNKPNGPLTTISAINAIREATGLKDAEILEDSEPIKSRA